MRINRFLVFFLIILFGTSCLDKTKEASKLSVISKNNVVEINNDHVKARFILTDSLVQQEFYARKQNRWELVVKSFISPQDFPATGNELYNSNLSPPYRYLSSNVLQNFEVYSENEEEVKIRLWGLQNDTKVEEFVTLHHINDFFHVESNIEFNQNPSKVEYFLSAYIFNHPGIPDFVHSPTIKGHPILIPSDKVSDFSDDGSDQIIGDRTFYSPAIILQENSLFCALVPDLDFINNYKVISPDARREMNIPRNKFSVATVEENFSMPTGLDLNVKNGLTEQPIFSFGFIDAVATHHMKWPHPNDGSMVRTINSNRLQYAFDLFIDAEVPAHSGFQKISRHMWNRYGSKLVNKPKPQAMPFEDYTRLIYDITFKPLGDVHPPVPGYKDSGSWLEFELDGQPVGGYRNAAPFWVDILSNSQFWNNVRDASGFFFWGTELSDSTLIDKARRIINLALLAPQNPQGLFPLIYKAAEKKWVGNSFDPPHGINRFMSQKGWDSRSYDIVALSKTSAHLLEYYQNCEKDVRILPYVKKYADFLITQIDGTGLVPSWYSFEMEPSSILKESAHPAASMWFLAELYNSTGEQKYLNGAEKIANYISEKILPAQNWRDLEHYFSCGALEKPLTYMEDEYQGQPTRGNLSNLWAVKGFASLYKGTKRNEYLTAGEKAIDYLSFFQTVWDPHFIYTAYPFGGFDTDNGDAAWLDARQAEMVEPFIWYGKELGRKDLLERGVAAARSSTTLINHPLHQENNIYKFVNIYPLGLGPENIDHEGHPQSAMRTSPSWGEGSAVFTGLSDAYRSLGGAFVDFKKNIAVGVNGLAVTKWHLEQDTVKLEVSSLLAQLPVPWDQPFNTSLKLEGLHDHDYYLVINNRSPELIKKEQLKELKIKVEWNGSIIPLVKINNPIF